MFLYLPLVPLKINSSILRCQTAPVRKVTEACPEICTMVLACSPQILLPYVCKLQNWEREAFEHCFSNRAFFTGLRDYWLRNQLYLKNVFVGLVLRI